METKTVRKVRAILLREGKIAVTCSKQSGAFMLPGGKIESEESYEETLKREILEELGIEISSDDLIKPFCRSSREQESTDDSGNPINKKLITTFYAINTTKDFDYTKMNLTPREIARGSKPYWVNPSKLEYFLVNKIDTYKSKYAIRYAQEFLEVYKKFKEYQIRNNKLENKDER